MKLTYLILFLFSFLLSGYARKSCYSRLEKDALMIVNGLIERKFIWNGGNLITYSLTDKTSKQCWLNKTKNPYLRVLLSDAVRRVLRVKVRLGLFETLYTPSSTEKERFLLSNSLIIAEQLAEESKVLLTNDYKTLPLTNVSKIAVIGPMAKSNWHKPIILILSSGRPLELVRLEKQSNAMLQIWQPGIAGGRPIAGILSGRINPSGKLSITFPYSTGQIPIYYNRRQSARPHQGKYQDIPSSPLYEFTHGLSYTHYSYRELSASKTDLHKGEKVSVSIPVSNDGDMDGMETVFLYVSSPYSRITRPVKELKRFDKHMIRKGEAVRFDFELDVNKDLGFVDDQGNQFVDAGEVNICIGDKSLKLHIE